MKKKQFRKEYIELENITEQELNYIRDISLKV